MGPGGLLALPGARSLGSLVVLGPVEWVRVSHDRAPLLANALAAASSRLWGPSFPTCSALAARAEANRWKSAVLSCLARVWTIVVSSAEEICGASGPS